MSQIKAEIIADSVSPSGKRMTTFVIEYPRFILAEFNTHRMLSKNSASSRAIPVMKVIKQVFFDPATPISWGKNKAGMSAEEELSGFVRTVARGLWNVSAKLSASIAYGMTKAGLHKQTANRILEPYQIMKTVVTGTEWENFFWLRNHPDAQPEIQFLAKIMQELYESSVPKELVKGQWHLPFYQDGYWKEHNKGYDVYGFTLGEATSISVSCCAQTSFRSLDDSIEKARKVVSRLNLEESNPNPKHSSPTEHQGTPMSEKDGLHTKGVTSVHEKLDNMSGNLSGFIQYRQLIKGHTKW